MTLKHLSVFAWILCCAPATAAPARPNVVMIIADDHAWTDYGFMGHPHIRTPHIDRLASESLAFRRGYVPSSLCCPSLASIITGLYPHQHKVTSNDPPVPPGISGREFHSSDAFRRGREVMNGHLEAVATLPRVLSKSGYLTLQTGKWWQGHYSHGGFTHGMTQGGRHGDDGLEIGRKTMQPIYDVIAASREKRQPFFIWYAPLMPHDPHTPPERLLQKYLPLAPSPHVARYWAMIEWFDETVGQLMATLDQQGLAENTVVVYLADNGWIQNPDGPRYAPRSKQSPYEGGIRTPILLRWPGHIAPRQSDSLAISIDLVPTILDLLDLPKLSETQGVSLMDERAVTARTSVRGECFTHNAVDLNNPAANLRWRWIVAGEWKLIVPDKITEPEGHTELFRISADPHETKDLAAGEPERVAELRAELDRWWNPASAK